MSVNLHGKNVLTKVTQIIGKKGVLSMSQHGPFWKGKVLHLGSNVSDSAWKNCKWKMCGCKYGRSFNESAWESLAKVVVASIAISI